MGKLDLDNTTGDQRVSVVGSPGLLTHKRHLREADVKKVKRATEKETAWLKEHLNPRRPLFEPKQTIQRMVNDIAAGEI